jgi:hypothetical protein
VTVLARAYARRAVRHRFKRRPDAENISKRAPPHTPAGEVTGGRLHLETDFTLKPTSP